MYASSLLWIQGKAYAKQFEKKLILKPSEYINIAVVDYARFNSTTECANDI